jgi:hypothetical protein
LCPSLRSVLFDAGLAELGLGGALYWREPY